jgi:hypothetical protein
MAKGKKKATLSYSSTFYSSLKKIDKKVVNFFGIEKEKDLRQLF